MRYSKFLFIIIIVFITAFPLFGEKWNPLRNNIILVGARPLGIGGAFIAVSDDVNAIIYNPAGLIQIKHIEISDTLDQNMDVKGLYNNFAGIVYPFKKVYSIGFGWHYIGFKDPKDSSGEWNGDQWIHELKYSENIMRLSFARKINEKIAIGANLRFSVNSIDLDMETQGRTYSFGIDAAVLYQVNSKIRIGAIINNLIPIKNQYSGGGGGDLKLPGLRLGFSYKFRPDMLLAFDLDKMMRIGFEYWLFNMIAFRAGFGTGILSKAEFKGNFQWAIGVGVRYKFIEFNYTWPGTPWAPLKHHVFSLAFSWNYHAYQIDVLSTRIDDMFASLYKSYARKDTVKVVVKNKTKNEMEASVGIQIPGLMKNAMMKKISLKPGVPTEVQLPVVFSPDEIMKVSDDSTRTAKVIVAYEHDNRRSEDTTTTKFVLYSRNAFIWDDIEKLGSFVTPQDKMIKEFARSTLQRMKSGGVRERVISNNFYKAMLIFDALGAYGQIYIADPSNPYGAAAETGGFAIDYIQYPQETLKQKSGDCDDCTVLYASMLENVGIPTMLVDVPGHIFMMFDSGVSPGKAANVFPNNDCYIELDGRVWVPVETTMFGRTFYSAWDEGIDTFKKWLSELNQSDDIAIHLVNMNSAWEKYPSATIKGKAWKLKLPDPDDINEIFKKDVDEYLADKEGNKFREIIDQYNSDPDNSETLNKLGILYAKNGIYILGEKYFTKILNKDPGNIKARNNLGNIYLITGDYNSAISEYKEVLKIDPNFSSAKKNLLKAEQAKKE